MTAQNAMYPAKVFTRIINLQQRASYASSAISLNDTSGNGVACNWIHVISVASGAGHAAATYTLSLPTSSMNGVYVSGINPSGTGRLEGAFGMTGSRNVNAPPVEFVVPDDNVFNTINIAYGGNTGDSFQQFILNYGFLYKENPIKASRFGAAYNRTGGN